MRIDYDHGCLDVPFFCIEYFNQAQLLDVIEVLGATFAFDGQVVAADEEVEARNSSDNFFTFVVVVVVFDVLI